MGRKSGKSKRTNTNQYVDLDQPQPTRVARADYINWKAVHEQWDALQELGYIPMTQSLRQARVVEESDADAWAKALGLLDNDDDSNSRVDSSSSRGFTSVNQDPEPSSNKSKKSPKNPFKRKRPLAPQSGNVVTKNKKKRQSSTDEDVTVASHSTKRVCKKHSTDNLLIRRQDENGDVVMCSCTDLDHIVE
jgi:hypothetical protein